MADFFVNKNAQANGDHEVHENIVCTSPRFPSAENAHYLGNFPSCKEAVRAAKQIYPQSDGCYYCANACHTR